MNKVRVALVGVGAMGKKYAKMLVGGDISSMKLAGVVIRKDELLTWGESLVDEDGDRPRIYRSTEEMFENSGDYDAVIIATPHKTHAEIALKAFALKKHVMCDKPAGITAGEADKMYKASVDAGVIYALMFHQHKYIKYAKIKEILDRGELGDLKRVMLVNSRFLRTKHYHDSGSWRSNWNYEGGGALINQGAHVLDMWQWLFGMPKTLYAEIPFGKYNDFKVDDEATITMRYDNNMTGVFMLSTGEAMWEERLEIIGSKGRILLEDDTMTLSKWNCDIVDYIGSASVNSREDIKLEEEVVTFDKQAEPYVEMLEEFGLAVISNNEKILTAPGISGINQIMLTNAAYYSAWNGVRVELPLDYEKYEAAYKKACEDE